MTSKTLPSGVLALAGAGLVLGAACTSASEPHGSPVLTKVYWSANNTQQVVWSPANDPDPTLVSSVSPFGNEIDFVFDRRLDGSRIEDIVSIDGSSVVAPMANGPIEATWPDMATRMSTPPFQLTVDYNSVPIYGGQSAYVFARPAVPGYPSGTTITFDLILANLTSAYGDLAAAPSSIAVKTQAFSAAIQAPTGAVATNFQLPLVFSNRLPPVPSFGASPAIHVEVARGAVPYKLLADANDGSRWYLAPADCLGAWPANTTFTVTIDGALTDAFGGALAQAATATFVTGAPSGLAGDAACAITDGGADGATDDGAPDAGAVESGSSDAGPFDGGGDAGTDAASGDAADVPVSSSDASDPGDASDAGRG